MRCSVCGHDSPPGSSFCLNCGSALAPTPPQTPQLGAGLPIICNACRGENPPGMKFCRQCGAALIATQPAVPAYQQLGSVGGAASTLGGPGNVGMGTPAPPAARPVGGGGSGGGGFPRPATNPVSSPGVLAAAPQGSTITCPRCGTNTPVGFAYCQQCGLHIQPIAPTDPGQLQPRARTPSSAPIGGNSGGAPIDPQGATIAQPDARPSLIPAGSAVPVAVRMKEPSARGPVALGTGPQWGSAVLVNRDGTDGQRFALTSDDTVVGRAGADIAFDDDRFLAKQHARLERAQDGSVRVHAIDELNGVFRKCDAPATLADGSIILVGREVLRFEVVAPEERTVHPLIRHGVALFGSPPRDPWGRIFQLVPSGGYRDVRHLIGDEVVLGREEGDIVFRDDAFMSRRHAAITWDGRQAKVTDLGSSNGTFVRIVGPTTLKTGDHIRMGDQLLRVELGR